MAEQIKAIVERLNQEPFNKRFSLISFDALDPLQLLQVLNDVFTEISAEHRRDLRDEAPEDTAVRMFSFLRVLKYKPQSEQGNLKAFRLGLVKGDKAIVYPILHWLLQRVSDLKKRAYLAGFLMKFDIPLEILQDDEVQRMHTQHEELKEEFKEAHKATERIKSSGATASEVRTDIANMEDERQQLKKRIERQKKKVQANVPSHEAVLAAATAHRKEKEREVELAEQKMDQNNQLLHLDQKFQRVRKQVHDLQTSNMGSTAEGLLQQLEEENVGNSYTVKEKLPKELELRRRVRDIMKQVVEDPAPFEEDLDVLAHKLEKANNACRKILEKGMERQKSSAEDKLSLFRQQANVVSRKKETAAGTLADLREEVARLDADLQEKHQRLEGVDGGVLEPEGMKQLMTSVRSNHDRMKMKKRELEVIQSENGVKERTLDLLHEQEEAVRRHLSRLEEEHGITGFQSTQDEMEKVAAKKSTLDEQKQKTLEEMSALVIELNKVVNEKKTTVGPLLADIRPLRNEHKRLTEELRDKKQVYDAEKAGVESQSSALEQKVRTLQGTIAEQESRLHVVLESAKAMEFEMERATAELKLYTSGTKDQGEKKSTFRDRHQKRMQQLDKESKELKAQQKTVRASHAENTKQMHMWQDVQALVLAKRKAFQKQEEQRQAEAAQERDILANEDRLVIQPMQ